MLRKPLWVGVVKTQRIKPVEEKVEEPTQLVVRYNPDYLEADLVEVRTGKVIDTRKFHRGDYASLDYVLQQAACDWVAFKCDFKPTRLPMAEGGGFALVETK